MIVEENLKDFSLRSSFLKKNCQRLMKFKKNIRSNKLTMNAINFITLYGSCTITLKIKIRYYP